MSEFVRLGEEDPMATLCRFVLGTEYDDLPDDVVDFAKKHILDTLGVTIAGSTQDGIPAIVDLVKEQGGKEESLLPFYGGKVPASMAALALGPMARALDMGDVHPEGVHTAEYVLPGILCTAGLKDKVSGKELITAFVVGEEVLIRIGGAVLATFGPASGLAEGGHYIFGVVAGVAKLLGLSMEELQNAMGIARCMTQPHGLEMYESATLMVRTHHGFVCQDAINACLLAKRGITGPFDIMLGPKGYLNQFGRFGTRPERLTEGLGVEWSLPGTMLKPYAACKCAHTSIGATIDVVQGHNIKPEDIAEMHYDIPPVSMRLVGEPPEVKWNPVTVPECQFSLPYTVAVSVLEKRVFIDAYTEEARARKDIRDLITKVTVTEDPELFGLTIRLALTLKDGTKYEKECAYVKGQTENPFTLSELIEKFRWMIPYSAYKLSDAVVDSLIERVLNLEKVDDVVADILVPLTPGA